MALAHRSVPGCNHDGWMARSMPERWNRGRPPPRMRNQRRPGSRKTPSHGSGDPISDVEQAAIRCRTSARRQPHRLVVRTSGVDMAHTATTSRRNQSGGGPAHLLVDHWSGMIVFDSMRSVFRDRKIVHGASARSTATCGAGMACQTTTCIDRLV